jgi:hypothetical protein
MVEFSYSPDMLTSLGRGLTAIWINEEIKRINAGKSISLIDDVIFKVKDNKVVYVGSLINVFELDLTFSTIAMEEAGYGEKTTKEIIYIIIKHLML